MDMEFDLFDSGYFRIAVPSGWMAFCGIDSECRTTPKKVHIFKGASLETDIFTHAGITICFFGKEDNYLSRRQLLLNRKVEIGVYENYNGRTSNRGNAGSQRPIRQKA